jgi:hypothetical protein
MSDIKIVRMVSGEDVMAEVTTNGSSLSFTNAVVLIPDQNNQISFIPYAPFVQGDTVTVPNDKTIYVADPDESITEHYKKLFSKIVTPSSQIIT